jgi:hypothetical protein
LVADVPRSDQNGDVGFRVSETDGGGPETDVEERTQGMDLDLFDHLGHESASGVLAGGTPRTSRFERGIHISLAVFERACLEIHLLGRERHLGHAGHGMLLEY